MSWRIVAEKYLLKAVDRSSDNRRHIHETPDQSDTGFAGAVFALIVTVAVMAGAAYGRNALWHDEIRLWEDTAKKSPGKAHARYNLGVHYAQAGRLRDAAGEYQAAVTLDPDYFWAHNNLGNLYLNEGRLDDALAEFLIAARLKPRAALVHGNLGYLYFTMGRMSDALREYEVAAGLDPLAPELHNDLGYIYATQHRYEEAIREYQTALQLKPDFSEARSKLDELQRALTDNDLRSSGKQ